MLSFVEAFRIAGFRKVAQKLELVPPNERGLFATLKKDATVVACIRYVYKFFSIDDFSRKDFDTTVQFYNHAYENNYGSELIDYAYIDDVGGVLVVDKLLGEQLDRIKNDKITNKIESMVSDMLWKMSWTGIINCDMTGFNIIVSETSAYFVDCDSTWLIGKRLKEIDSNVCYFVMAFILASTMRMNKKYIMWPRLRSLSFIHDKHIVEDIINTMNKSAKLRRIALHYCYSKTKLTSDKICSLSSDKIAGPVFDSHCIYEILNNTHSVSQNDVYRMIRIPGSHVVVAKRKRA